MSLISPAELRARDIGGMLASATDDALQGLIDACESEIVSTFGPHMTFTSIHSGGTRNIFPGRPIRAVASVSQEVGGVTTVLASDDHQIIDGGYTLRRISTGTNPATRWYGTVTLEAVAQDDIGKRVNVLIDLCKHDAVQTGLVSRTMGSWSESYGGADASDPDAKRRSILRRLAPAMVLE